MNHLTVKVLLAFFCATVFFLYNLSYKSSHNGVSFIDSFTTPKNVEGLPANDVPRIINSKFITSPNPINKMHTPASTCVVYGPILHENKSFVDILLEKTHLTALFSTVDKPVYEVYWNLGKDKITAIELFEVQKNDGPLQDEKYKLALNDDNDWIVSISKIIANEPMAKDLATNLAIKANKIQAGGKWQYKNNSTVYFYQTDNASKVPNEVTAVMEKTFSIVKNKCI